MKLKLLLGETKSNELIFGNISIKDFNFKNEFSASFDTVYPTILTKEDALERIESSIECYDADSVLDLLQRFDCRPSELADQLYEESYCVIQEFYDNSLYSETFDIDSKEIFFESVGCGQNGTRNELMTTFVNKELYDYIHELWDNYHLKVIPEECIEKLTSLIESHSIDDEEAYIEKWLIDKF